MRAVWIHTEPSSGTAADLWQIEFLDLLFCDSFWKGKNLSGAAKLETALNFTSSSLQVEAKHKFYRRKKLGKKVPWTVRGKPKIL